MKRLLVVLTASIVVAVPLLLINCELIPEGLETTVRGQVYDSIKQKMLEGVKVIVWACVPTYSSMGPSCHHLVDSGRTDEQGRFKIDFVTEGDASRYYLSIDPESSFHVPELEEKVHAGADEFTTMYAQELNYIKVEVHIDNNPFGPMLMESASYNMAKIYQHTKDTIIYGRVLPGALNHVTFSVYDETVGMTRASVDELNVGLNDTTYVKNITDPTLWQVQ